MADRSARARDVPVPSGFDPRRHLSGIGAQLAGQANVILQLRARRRVRRVYWEESLAEVRIDPPVRDFLLRLTLLQNLPRPLQRLGPRNLFVTTGFLPPTFREAMGLSWDETQQARFDRMMRRYGRVERALPTALRIFPFNALLGDLRRRIRRNRPLV